jgi:nucleotide-binding universal stress UspA family protein
VAVTGESCDDEAVRLACNLLGQQNGELYIVYVIEVERSLPVDAEIAPATAKAEQVLKRAEETSKSFRGEIHAEMLQSRKAGPALVHEAVDKMVDVMIISVLYSELYGSFSMGETAPYVLEHSPCKVIVWRESIPTKLLPGRSDTEKSEMILH